MKKLIIPFLLIGLFGFAQDEEKFSLNKTLFIKGIGYINLLDGGFGSILGTEKGFFNNHSIGAKFIYNHFLPRQEIKNEEGNYEPGDYTKDRDLSLIVEYKYYFDFKSLNQNRPYISISYKTGKNTIDKDSEYEHDYYHQEIKYNYFGPALGCLFLEKQSKRIGIDVQLGYLFGKKDLVTEYVVPNRFDLFESYDTTRWRIEVMFVYSIDWR